MDTKSKTGTPEKGPTINRSQNYKHTLDSLQRNLPGLDRKFSRFIHSPLVEKTSELLERTLMRPMVVVVATWSALITGLVFYLTARYYGFQLSGSEVLLGLAAGAVLGLIIEALTRITRRR